MNPPVVQRVLWMQCRIWRIFKSDQLITYQTADQFVQPSAAFSCGHINRKVTVAHGVHWFWVETQTVKISALFEPNKK